MATMAKARVDKDKRERITICVDKATLHDVSGIHSVLLSNRKDTQLFQRTRADIQRNVRDFFVATNDRGSLLGCLAVHFHSNRIAEVLSVAVAPEHHGKGIGPRLLEAGENAAREAGAETVWLVCEKPVYFERLGYKRISRFKLPASVWMSKVRQTFDQTPGRWLPNLLWRMKFMVRMS